MKFLDTIEPRGLKKTKQTRNNETESRIKSLPIKKTSEPVGFTAELLKKN
jgi:hypothetical protein